MDKYVERSASVNIDELTANLTEEQKNAVAACESPEDIMALAKKEGYSLSDEELEFISGGGTWTNQGHLCPYCNSRDTVPTGGGDWRCNHCGGNFDNTAPN